MSTPTWLELVSIMLLQKVSNSTLTAGLTASMPSPPPLLPML